MAYLALLMLLQAAAAPPAESVSQRPEVQLASSQASTTPSLASQRDKMICRRYQKTGSLAGFERVCRTKAEWQKLANEQQSAWRDVQGHKGAAWCPPGYDGTQGTTMATCGD
jgi:hypothetical protein